MIDVAPDKKVIKLSATVDDDINLILDAITKVENAFVLLVIPEGNDLLNSPIGLKALRKKTLEKNKRLVLVVPPGPAYELVKDAGFVATTAADAVNSSLWQQAIEQYDEYYHATVGMNSKKPVGKKIEKSEKKEKIEYIDQAAPNLPVPEIISSNTVTIPAPSIKTEEPVASEKPVASPVEEAKPNVTGVDFSKLVKQGKPTSFFAKKTPSPMSVNTVVTPQEVNTFHPDLMPKTVGKPVAKITKKREANPLTNFILMGLVGLLLIGASVFAAYYIYFPRVKVDMQVQSVALTLTDQVTATSAVTGFDVNKKEVQLIKEKETKNATLPFTATQQSADGVKATGTVFLDNTDTNDKNVPAGTLLTSGTYNFVTQSAVTVPGKSGGALGHAAVNVQASDFGEEYNLPAGSSFSVQGFSSLSGGNNTPFSGGTKRTFVVVGQADVDKATKDLQTDLQNQAVSDLMYMDQDRGFEFIKDSVKTTSDKTKYQVSPAVGTEVKPTDQDPTVTMFTTTTALYYHKESLVQLAERMLLEKYRASKNLSEADAANTVIDQLNVVVTKITVGTNDKVTVAFSASGLATARIDTDQVRTAIAGKKWPDMLTYLSSIPTLQGAPKVTFSPSWLPDFMKYVPKEPGRIDITVTVVQPSAATSQ